MTTVLEKIHQFNRFGSILGLERMNILLGKLGEPHKNLDVIHVAGTNGKGSVCKFFEEGLSACGYKMGLYTSPFIEKFNERIRLGGEDISDENLEIYGSRVLEAAEAMVAEGHHSPTEFEVVTAIAFLYFKEKGSDIVILEVGLGGIGDSTNVIDKPLASVICSISYDHMKVLGNTLAEIAAEKAGIIKPGAPVISNVPEREAAVVIAKAAYERGCRLYDASRIDFGIFDETPFFQKVSMDIYGTDYSDVAISMVGRHQGENLKTALAVIEVLRKAGKIKVERSRLYAGLRKAKQPGRFEILTIGNDEKHEGSEAVSSARTGEAAEKKKLGEADSNKKPLVIIDGAHNEAGACALQETMQEYFGGQRILLITGMLADKQVDKILKCFVSITHDIIVTEPDNPRKLDVGMLEEYLKDMGIQPRAAIDAKTAVELARSIWDDYNVVIFAGSLYLIGDVRRILTNE